LILGYGNADRQDDGVAWHVLKTIMQRSGLSVTDELDIDFQDDQNNIDYIYQLQLVPEIAYDLNKYDRVCFIDAHTGAVPEKIHFEVIQPGFQKSPFTHHLTAASLISIYETLHNISIEAVIVSIRGYHFGFSRSLSESTSKLVENAVDVIEKWIESPQKVK
jgi:hydrogenase maturation protease